MIYVSSNLEADVKILMFRGSDFKDDPYIFYKTDRAGQFKHWFIDIKIVSKRIENSQYVHPPHPHPTSTTIAQLCEVHVDFYA